MSVELLKKEYEDCEGDYDGLVGFEYVEESDWVSEGKYQTSQIIVKDDVNFYAIVLTRSGSYHSDYNDEETNFFAVYPKLITKTIYITRKPS